MSKILSPRLLFVITAVGFAALTRVLPHPPNFTAITAMALFAGACVSNRWLAMLVPVLAMVITDLFLPTHNTTWAVYGSLMLITMLGWAISKKQNFLTITGASLASVLIFFFITNAAMWVVGFFGPGFYPQTADGLVAAIASGIPFMANSLLSHIVYAGVLFGAFHAIKAWKPSLVKA